MQRRGNELVKRPLKSDFCMCFSCAVIIFKPKPLIEYQKISFPQEHYFTNLDTIFSPEGFAISFVNNVI